MKLLSWNINGIRAVMRKGFLDFLKKEKPDVLALQETKINNEARAKHNFDFANYVEFWNFAERPGYSGTAILVKENIAKKYLISNTVINGIGIEEFDCEGRIQTLEFKNFYFINAYFPNSGPELARLDYKLRFDAAILKYLKKLERKKPVIIAGDFNVAHEEIDIARPKENIGNAGFTYEEREWMTKFIKAGFVDIFRYMHPNKIEYSWWSYRARARERNIGWRIDYFLVSAKIIKHIKKSFILNDVYGSDHCPVGIIFK